MICKGDSLISGRILTRLEDDKEKSLAPCRALEAFLFFPYPRGQMIFLVAPGVVRITT